MESRSIFPTIDVKKYGGKQVAILDGTIIAVGTTLKDVIGKVKAQEPSRELREVKIFTVPKTLTVIYYVSSVPLRHHASGRRKVCRISCR